MDLDSPTVKSTCSGFFNCSLEHIKAKSGFIKRCVCVCDLVVQFLLHLKIILISPVLHSWLPTDHLVPKAVKDDYRC